MIAFGDQNLGWNLNMLKHVVHLDLIHIFVVSTNDRFVPGEKPDDKKLTNLLKNALLKSKLIAKEAHTRR